MKNKNIKILIISSLVSLFLIIVGYFANNWSILTGESILTLSTSQLLGNFYDPDDNDVFFVNVSYDREIVKLKDEPEKNSAIVDRIKLYKFLKVLKEEGEYKYIVLDILFDTNEVSEMDSLLYPLIASMKNIVVARDTSLGMDSILLEKSALVDYDAINTQSTFLRYKYLREGEIPSIPLKVYEDLHPKDSIKKHGLVYTSGNKLCQNACFIPFDDKFFSSQLDSQTEGWNEEYLYNLGADILNDPTSLREDDWKKNIISLSKGKYVFVGDYKNDMHDTYMGTRPGTYILYRAFKTLEENKHIVSFCTLIIWFIVFTGTFYLIISDRKKHHLPRFIRKLIKNNLLKSRFIRFILSLVGYTFILWLCSLLQYVFTQTFYSITIPLIVFALTKLFMDYRKFEGL